MLHPNDQRIGTLLEGSLPSDKLQRVFAAQISRTKKQFASDLNFSEQYDESLLSSLIDIDCPLQDKFSILRTHTLLHNNCTKYVPLKKVTACFRILTRYGQNLVKPDNERPKLWRQVPSEFLQRWGEVQGAVDILQSYGYTDKKEWGIEYPEGVPSCPEHICMLITELILLTLELEAYESKKHPHRTRILEVVTSPPPTAAESLKYVCQPPSSPGAFEAEDTSPPFLLPVASPPVSSRSEVAVFGPEPAMLEGALLKPQLTDTVQNVPVVCSFPEVTLAVSSTIPPRQVDAQRLQQSSASTNPAVNAVAGGRVMQEAVASKSSKSGVQVITLTSETCRAQIHPIPSNNTSVSNSDVAVAFVGGVDIGSECPNFVEYANPPEVSFGDYSIGNDGFNTELFIRREEDGELSDSLCAGEDCGGRATTPLETPTTSEEKSNAEMVLRKAGDTRVRDGTHCDLCGCSAPAVRCEKCSHQIFCLSCDDMYHRHPKRRSHVRKAVDVSALQATKPPLAAVATAKKESDPVRLPVPPPRRRKSQKSVPSSPVFNRKTDSENPPLPKKEFSFMDKVGSLRRFMIGRPLPPVPKDEAPDRPPKSGIWQQPNNTPAEQPPAPQLHISNYRKQSAGSSGTSDNEVSSAGRELANVRNGRNSPGYDNVPTNGDEPVWGGQVKQQNYQNGSGDKWNQVNNRQSSYPSSLTNKSDSDSGVHTTFQGFPTLPKNAMHPQQYLDRAATLSNRMPAVAPHSNSVSDLQNRPFPQHPQMPMHLPQAQSVQGLSYVNPPHMQRGGNPHYMDPCGYNPMMPWMAQPMHHPDPYNYYHDPQMGPYPLDQVKRTPSSSSVNYSGSETGGIRLNSYTSMGHLHNPVAAVQPPHHYPHHHPHSHGRPHGRSHGHRELSPTLSTHSTRLRAAQSIGGDVGDIPYYQSGRRSAARGYPGGGRRSALERTSSEEDYFSAGASDDDDYISIRSGRSELQGNQVPNRQWMCEHCTFVNPPGTRICSVCCKTTTNPKRKSDRRHRRVHGGGGAKSPSSGESLPPAGHRKGSSRMGKEALSSNQDSPYQDEIESPELINGSLESETVLHNYLEASLNLSNAIDVPSLPNAADTNASANVVEVYDKSTRGAEQYQTTEIGEATATKPSQENGFQVSTGTSPLPPQTMSAQTAAASSDEPPTPDDMNPGPMYRTNSRNSLTGTERNYHMDRRDSWGVPPYNYRTGSRTSLFNPHSRDVSPMRSLRGDPDYHSGYRDRRYPYESGSRTDYYLSLEDLIERRRQDTMRTQGFELVRLLRDAEQHNFTADDLQVALTHCGSQNPIQWLNDNWKNMIETVVTLVTNYGRDKKENDIGVISTQEAKEALRSHKGNIWASVTECVELRQRKFNEIHARGDFSREEVIGALTANCGNLEAAFLELSKNMMKPFTMKIWGPPIGVENESGSTFNRSKSPAPSPLPSPATSPPKSIKAPSVNRNKSPSPSVVTGKLTLPLAAAPEEITVITNASLPSPVSTASTTLPTQSSPVVTTTVFTTTEKVYSPPSDDGRSSAGSSSDSPAAWRKALSGGESAVGGAVLQQTGNSSISFNSSFKPTTTSRKLSRTGSFSGGSFQIEEDEIPTSDKTVSTVVTNDVDVKHQKDNEDLYVTVQWVSGKKPESLMDPPSPPPVIPIKTGGTKTLGNEKRGVSLETMPAASDSSALPLPGKFSTMPQTKSSPAKAKPTPTKIQPAVGSDASTYSTVEFIRSLEVKDDTGKVKVRKDGKNNSTPVTPTEKTVINANLMNVINSELRDGTYAPVEFIRAQGVPRSRCNSPIRQIIRPASPTVISHIEEQAAPPVGQIKEYSPPPVDNKANQTPPPSPVTVSPQPSSDVAVVVANGAVLVQAPVIPPKSPLVKCKSNVPSPLAIPAKVESLNQKKQPTSRLASRSESPVLKGKERGASRTTSRLASRSESPVLKSKSRVTSPLAVQHKIEFSATVSTEEEVPSPTEQRTRSPLANDTVTSPAVVQNEAEPQQSQGDAESPSLIRKKQDAAEVLSAILQPLVGKHDGSDNEKAAASSMTTATTTTTTGSSVVEEPNAVVATSESGVRAPTPPLRTESSKLSPQHDFERRARMLLAEGKVTTYEKAELAVKLMDYKFEEYDALCAAQDCSDVYTAISYLQQDCELCAAKFPMRQMVSMLNCTHCCCLDCAKAYYSIQIRDRNIMEAVCPFCNEPDLTDDEIAQDYFNNLDIVLKSIVDPEIHELFQRKLRDRTLMRDPNFHWCSQCASGFIAHPMAKRLICPDCKVVTCAQCRRPWEAQHEGIACEMFAEWKEGNDPEFQAMGLEKHLAENGIDCPNCRFRYALAKGGCMHFRCLQCKYDFCSGCGRSFKMGLKCNFSEHCGKLGLHAHHPRNCLFYLRDKEPTELQKLLTEHEVAFDTEPLPGTTSAMTESALRKCPVMEQKEIAGAMVDDICGSEVPEGHAGLCRLHYIEYLVGLINSHAVDPLTIFDATDLQQEIRRRGKELPEQGRHSDAEFRNVLIQVIQEQIPLDETGGR